ncbi:DUF2971 domain-containing protein [Acinetobacter johnsonii]|uniref:DUF2971 domain-containing protein n=1 Tax=Acinetobacter johnsonii TaxID=40214 RepID=UPI001F3BF809|nr:DUF2971 domain-containing protein [Acinetobacter johnsonii]UJA04521.1 DUF2971 domain-containing protein [Acinetobacter johnsonii]
MHNSSYSQLMGIIDNCPDDLIFYHYCSSDTFLAICTGKKLRFSDMHSMNDSLEGTWGYDLFIQVGNKLISENKISINFLDKLDEILHYSSSQYLKLICCLSKDGDVLSQWRAYTNDASGYCIGFSAKDLSKMPVRILDVVYDIEKQSENLTTILLTLNKLFTSTDDKEKDAFIQICHELSINLARFKNPAFKEELEIRLMHVAVLDISDEDNPKYKFDNGFVDGKSVSYAINYRINHSVPTAFIDFDFLYNDVNPIKEVILGPKNNAHPMGVIIAMSTMGLKDVKVKRSEASYR